MKRFFAMLILLVVVGCTAHADEILFRGIPWGVSYPKMHELIKADVVGEFETEASEPSEIEYIDTGRTENDCGFNSGLWFAEGIDVAGYPLYNIWIVSRYGVLDGTVSDSPDDVCFDRRVRT